MHVCTLPLCTRKFEIQRLKEMGVKGTPNPLICMKRCGGVHDVYLFPGLKSLSLSVLALIIHTQSVNILKKELLTTNKSSFPLSIHSFLITNEHFPK